MERNLFKLGKKGRGGWAVKVNDALNNKTSPGNTHVNNKKGTDLKSGSLTCEQNSEANDAGESCEVRV